MKTKRNNTRIIRSQFCSLTPEGMIEIRPNGERDETYRIRLNEVDTLPKLQDYVRHLAKRIGYTNAVIGDLVILLARHRDPFGEYEQN